MFIILTRVSWGRFGCKFVTPEGGKIVPEDKKYVQMWKKEKIKTEFYFRMIIIMQ
jgi:hypothetical protein